MEYRWEEGYCLDRTGTLLTHHGQQIHVSRKLLDCIAHLIEQRHRVVGYDELIRVVWGHENVTNHQLSQLVLTARRALGDDGRAQRVIRTMPGLGYRWTAPVQPGPMTHTAAEPTAEPAGDPGQDEVDLRDAPSPIAIHGTPSEENLPGKVGSMTEGAVAPSADSTPTPLSPALATERMPAPPRSTRTRLRSWTAGGLTLLAITMAGWWFQDRPGLPPATAATSVDPLAAVEDRLWRADREGVRAGLLNLPPALAASPEARMLEIRLYIDKRRYDQATEKLEVELTKSRAAADVVWQARLLTLQSRINREMSKSAPEVFDPAQQALKLLESIGDKAPQLAIGEALSARGTGYMFHGRLRPAVQDFVRARDILLKDGDQRRATETRHMLAHVWMRMGRMSDALEEFKEIAALSQRQHDPAAEMRARDSATRIQIELLRWDEALANSQRSMRAASRLPDESHRIYTIRLHALVLMNTGRLREAASLLDDTAKATETGSASLSMYRIMTGDTDGALANSATMFDYYDPSSNVNLILSSQEGALMLWMIAAQDRAAAGRAMPSPSSAQMEVLQRPQSIPGRIARGRWLWSTRMTRQAEEELRDAFEESTRNNRFFYMTLAAEPLIGLLLERKDIPAADAVLASLRGSDPDRMDRDYRVNVLRLRVALAKGDAIEIQDAHRKALAVAGERSLQIKPPPSMAITTEHNMRVAGSSE